MADPATKASELREGLILGGKYRLEAEIGRGAMGTVWAAMHDTLGQRVAIKVISEEHAKSEELRKRFDTEARAAAKLRSRFVVGVYDNGVTDLGLPYIVMEYLEGECLEDRIARLGSIPVAEAARIARHVTRALSKAHSHGIIHRDLKPANIFITESDDEDDGDDWTAKVLDFGIAKMDDYGDRSTTKTGTVLGTPLFMSPEQVRGASDVDPRADLYSFGMVIYNMLTGTFAFEGQSFGDLLVSICTDPLPPMSQRAPHSPPALDTWFAKACARDPDDRYQTADELMKALTEAIGDTAPATRLSLSDISSTEHMVPLAETFVANSEVAQSGSRPLDTHGGVPSSSVPSAGISSTSASSFSVAEDLKKKSKLPLIIGAAAVLIGGAIAVIGLGSHNSVGATQPAPQEDPAEKAAKTIEDNAPENVPEPADSPDAPATDEPSDDGSSVEQATVDQRHLDTKKPKPVAKPTAPARTPKPAATADQPKPAAPAAKPTPKPAPKTNPSVPDLGF